MKKTFLTFILLFNILFALAENINFKHLGMREGLPQINILSIYQDELGAMWFGTIEGVARYNGNEIETFGPSEKNNGLTQNIIYSICGNKNGAIYLKAGNDLIRYDLRKEKFDCIKKGGVRAIYSKQNNLWFATDSILYRYEDATGEIKVYAELTNIVDKVTTLYVSDDRVWIGSVDGIAVINTVDDDRTKKMLEGLHVTTIYVDNKHQVWVGTHKDGVYVINHGGEVLSHFKHIAGKNSLSNDQIRAIAEDNTGKIWIGTFLGLNSYDDTSGEWMTYIHLDDMPHSLTHSSIFSLYRDTQGSMWIGTYFGGVNYFNSEADIFKFYSTNALSQNRLSFPFVGNMFEDDNDNLWICTEGGGLNCLNLKTRKFSHYMNEGPNFESSLNYNQKCIWYREDKQWLYLGIHNGGLSIFDIETKRFRSLFHKENDSTSLPNNIVERIQFFDGELFLITHDGMVKMNLKTERFEPVSRNPKVVELLKRSTKTTFYIDKSGELWLPFAEGLMRINLKTEVIKRYHFDEKNDRSIGKLRITNILESKLGQLFFATAGSGLFMYEPKTDDFESYTVEKNGLMSNYCYDMTEAPSGNLILLHNKGVAFFDPKDPNKLLFRSLPNFLLSGFSQGSSSYVVRDGEIFIGGINGLVSVYESQLKYEVPKKYNFYLDRLFVDGKQIKPNDGSKILDKALGLCQKVELEYNQNDFTIKFASSNYLQNSVQTYEYMLDGFDKTWHQTASNMITYTNIQRGDYKLLVKETIKGMSEGKTKINTLDIIVKPPFSRSGLAYFLYFIVFCGALFCFLIWRKKWDRAVKQERGEKAQNEELTQMKLRFFTNISHELRTPLTLILGHTESLLSITTPNTKVRNKILRIYKNANHMLSLVSELLDFRKQEEGFYKLRVEQIELVEYVRAIYESFQEHAVRHHIRYRFEYSDDRIYVYIDPYQFKKVIYNLLSNAFKYTPSEGEITVRIRQQHNKVLFQVEDDGIGIAPESLSKIFDCFYQYSERINASTGIGLSLVKGIVESHKGKIKVHSAVDKGSVFEVDILLGNSHFSAEEFRNNPKTTDYFVDENIDVKSMEEDIHLGEEMLDEEKSSILLVDDNEELLGLLTDLFSGSYKVYTAANGKVALEMVQELQPDIVLSDVMMPEMSGKELCYKIKNNINISHIPVVLLTSQDSPAQTIEGYIFGADDYIIKPFNVDVLVSRIKNLVRNRKLLFQTNSRRIDPVVSVDTVTEHDKAFIDKVIAIIRDNFDDSEFDMNVLASELGLGRNKLYSRVKEITGLTPNEFTLNLKLHEAVCLLNDALHLNVSDIAIHLGFSSTKYFSKCFKTFYGIAPQQWRKENQKDK